MWDLAAETESAWPRYIKFLLTLLRSPTYAYLYLLWSNNIDKNKDMSFQSILCHIWGKVY